MDSASSFISMLDLDKSVIILSLAVFGILAFLLLVFNSMRKRLENQKYKEKMRKYSMQQRTMSMTPIAIAASAASPMRGFGGSSSASATTSSNSRNRSIHHQQQQQQFYGDSIGRDQFVSQSPAIRNRFQQQHQQQQQKQPSYSPSRLNSSSTLFPPFASETPSQPSRQANNSFNNFELQPQQQTDRHYHHQLGLNFGQEERVSIRSDTINNTLNTTRQDQRDSGGVSNQGQGLSTSSRELATQVEISNNSDVEMESVDFDLAPASPGTLMPPPSSRSIKVGRGKGSDESSSLKRNFSDQQLDEEDAFASTGPISKGKLRKKANPSSSGSSSKRAKSNGVAGGSSLKYSYSAFDQPPGSVRKSSVPVAARIVSFEENSGNGQSLNTRLKTSSKSAYPNDHSTPSSSQQTKRKFVNEPATPAELAKSNLPEAEGHIWINDENIQRGKRVKLEKSEIEKKRFAYFMSCGVNPYESGAAGFMLRRPRVNIRPSNGATSFKPKITMTPRKSLVPTNALRRVENDDAVDEMTMRRLNPTDLEDALVIPPSKGFDSSLEEALKQASQSAPLATASSSSIIPVIKAPTSSFEFKVPAPVMKTEASLEATTTPSTVAVGGAKATTPAAPIAFNIPQSSSAATPLFTLSNAPTLPNFSFGKPETAPAGAPPTFTFGKVASSGGPSSTPQPSSSDASTSSKPVVPSTSSSPAVNTAVSFTGLTKEPAPVAAPLFSFPTTKPATTEGSTTALPSSDTSKPNLFNIAPKIQTEPGTSDQAAKPPSSQFNFGAPSTTEVKGSPFTFGNTAAPPPSAAPPPEQTPSKPFVFGQPASTPSSSALAAPGISTPSSSAVPSFNFGVSIPNSTPSQPPSQTASLFGGQSSTPAAQSSTPAATTTAPATPGVSTAPTFQFGGFGGASSSTPTIPLFGGAPATPGVAPTSLFGGSPAVATPGVAPVSLFGAAPATPGIAPPSLFGGAASSSTKSEQPVPFGFQPTSAKAPHLSVPMFGAPSTTAAPTFGAPSATPLFGAPNSVAPSPFGAPAATVPTFGSAPLSQATSSTTNLFGQPPQQQQQNAFGAGSTSSQSQQPPASQGAFSFSAPTGASAPTFGGFGGAAQPTQFAGFGAQAAPSNNAFGQPQQQQQQQPSFGQPQQQQQQPTFGQPQQQQPAFGQPQQQPAFGQTQQQPAFGQPQQQQQPGTPSTPFSFNAGTPTPIPNFAAPNIQGRVILPAKGRKGPGGRPFRR